MAWRSRNPARQRSIRIAGPNLWRPDLADNSVVFHARRECEEIADEYRYDADRQGVELPSAPAQLPGLDGEAPA